MAIQDLIDQINEQFHRLEVGTDADPYSGLMIFDVAVEEPPSPTTVRVVTDHMDGEYKAAELLSILQGLEGMSHGVTLDPHSNKNIWDLIRPAEA